MSSIADIRRGHAYVTPRWAEPLPERDRLAIFQATSTRGPRKGALLKRPPPPSRAVDGYTAWHAVRAAQHADTWGYLPNDCGVAGIVMYGDGTHSEMFERIFDAATAELQRRRAARRDRTL